MTDFDTRAALDLLDWKRRVFDAYRVARDTREPTEGWRRWREVRDELFRTHPQSPLPPGARRSFGALDYFDYDESYRTMGELGDAPAESYEIPTSGDEPMRFSRIATCSFELNGSRHALEVYWLDAYGGGLFLPLRDATSGKETYGAGRYLLDTVKGADLGTEGSGLVLDFNFAYNPSCSYDPRWVCPLAPPPNRLDIAILAGEKHSEK